jgi:serine protease Do
MQSGSARKTRWGIFAAVAVVALTIGGMLRAGVIPTPGQAPGATGGQKVPLHLAQNTSPVELGSFRNGFSSIIDPALPAVVNISSTKMVRQQNNLPGFLSEPFLRQFFGNQFGNGQQQQQAPQMEREYSLGSGVIVNGNGYVLTNNHVVADAQDVEVFTQSRKEYKAKVVGTDPRTDIAVLKIDASGLPTMTLGDSTGLKVGDLVFAIGDPFGIGETATMGIVSATGRAMGGAIEHYEDFIQTDAAINPGNSGGALIDAHGDLIGINTAIIAGQNGGGNEGIGFAIPINMARNIMEQIVEHGKVVRGYLGVTVQEVSPDMAKAFGLSQGGGGLVGDVSPNSPAAKAGLQRGDIILQINGATVNGPDDLSVRTAEMAPGTVVHVEIYRNGNKMGKDVTLGTYPNGGKEAQPANAGPATTLQGIEVQNLTPDLRQQLNLPSGVSGVVVSQVDPTSTAAMAGLQRGDVIQEVNRKPVHNMDEYRQAVAGLGNQPVLLLVNRAGTTHFVVLQPQG